MSAMQAAREATADIGPRGHGDDLFARRHFLRSRSCRPFRGRFLYQFGITAAVAILVSLLVSFTLRMMSSRLLKNEGKGTRTRSRRSIRH